MALDFDQLPELEDDSGGTKEFKQLRDSANVKDIIEQLRQTPVSHTNFENFKEKARSQREIIKSHMNEKISAAKSYKVRFEKEVKDDKTNWWMNDAPRIPILKNFYNMSEEKSDLVGLQQTLLNLYEAVIMRYEDALKNAKTLDLQREVTNELNKLMAENNKFMKEMMNENNKLVKDSVTNQGQIFTSTFEMTHKSFLEQLKASNQRQRDFEEKVLHVLLAHGKIDDKDFAKGQRQISKQPVKNQVVEVLDDDDDDDVSPQQPQVQPLTEKEIRQAEPKNTDVLIEASSDLSCKVKGCGYIATSPVNLEIHKKMKHVGDGKNG
jgi:hypothetical protein